jgi:SPX domain protein involved in polyphosphate accumulation
VEDLISRVSVLQAATSTTATAVGSSREEQRLEEELTQAYRLLTEAEARLNATQSELVLKTRDLDLARVHLEQKETTQLQLRQLLRDREDQAEELKVKVTTLQEKRKGDLG